MMVRAILLAGVLALMLSPFAAAQEHHDEHKGGPPHGAPGGPPHGPPGGAPHFVPQHAGPKVGPVGPSHAFVPGPHPGPAMEVHPGPGMGVHPGPVMGVHMGPGGHAQFGYHGHFFNPVHVSPFIYPQGWAYRRWAVGAVLPPLFLAPNYYYTDWATLGLDPPPPGAQWVRYGPDLLMVDVASGSVIEVVPDVFYQ